MKVSLIRHGEASFDAPSDFDRPLTELGIDQNQRVIKGALEAGWQPERVWVSPLLRAKQTCATIQAHIEIHAEEKRFLTPDTDPARVLREIARAGEFEHLLLVAHQPLLGGLASLMQEGNIYEAHPFVTSEMLCLESDMVAAGLFELSDNWRP